MAKLTKKQKELLDDLVENSSMGASRSEVECTANEFRTAQALERKGYLKILEGRSQLGAFEVRLNDICFGDRSNGH